MRKAADGARAKRFLPAATRRFFAGYPAGKPFGFSAGCADYRRWKTDPSAFLSEICGWKWAIVCQLDCAAFCAFSVDGLG
jgi:hypothetical protein